MKEIPFVNSQCLLFLFGMFLCLPTVTVAQPVQDSATHYYRLALQPLKSDDLFQTYAYYERLKERQYPVQDTMAAIHTLRMLAIVQFNLGMWQDSEVSVVEALTLTEGLKQNEEVHESKRGFYNQLGKVYRELKDSKRALQYYEYALQLTDNLRDSITIINNQGNLYKDEKKYKQAEAFYQIAYSKSLQTQDTLQLAMALDNLSFVQIKLGDPEAVKGLHQALGWRLRIGDLKGQYASYRHLARIALDNNNLAQVQTYARQALEVAETLNSPAYTKDALSLLMETSGDSLVLAYKKIVDSLDTAKLQQENTYASLKYDIAKEKERTAASELLKEKEKRHKQLYQFLGLVVFLIAVLVVYRLRHRHRKAKQQEVYRTEMRISKKVHDEVANDIYKVMAGLQMEGSPNTALLDELEDIYTKTRDISRENSMVMVNGEFAGQLQDMLLGYGSDAVTIITRNSADMAWDTISAERRIAVYRVLQELMTNMKKHSKATFVVITFQQNGKKVKLTYKDNGIGGVLKKHIGLQNVENRILAIKGSITFVSEPGKGFQATLEI